MDGQILISTTIAASIATVVATLISLMSLYISTMRNYLTERPYLVLSDIKFNKNNFKLYSNIAGKNHIPLDDEILGIVKNSYHSISMQSIKGEEYFLINLLKKNTKLEDIYVTLAPVEFTYDNTGGSLNEIVLKKSYARLKEYNHKFPFKINQARFCPNLDNRNKFTFKIAYVTKEWMPTSFLFKELINATETEFSFLHSRENVKKFVNFTEEYFKIKCRNHCGRKYTIRIVLKNKDDIIYAYIK